MEEGKNTTPTSTVNRPISPSVVKPRTNDSTKKLFIWLRALGVIIPKKNKVAYVIYSITFNTLCNLLLPQFFLLSYFTSEITSIALLLTSVQACMNTYACSIKFMIIVYLKKNIFNMVQKFEKLDTRVKYPEEIKEIQWAIIFGHRAFKSLATFYLSYSGFTFLGGLYLGRPSFSLYIPFLDWRDSKRSLLIVSVIEYVLMSMACFQQVANDAYAIVYVKLIHTHLKLLISRVLRIGIDKSISKEDNRKELVWCIHDHKTIIELIDTITPLISATVFVQFVVSAACLSTTLVNILIFSERLAIIGSVAYIVALLSEIFPICYFVNCLMMENECLPDAIFHMNWVDQDLKFRRICLYFMHKSQQPVVFMAGKIFPITLNSFVSIVKFSFSLYTLINAMDLGERFK